MNITSIYRLLFVAYCLLEKLVVPKAFTLARGRPWMPDLLSVSPALRYVSTVDRIVSDIKERKGKRNDRVEADTQAANCTQSHFFCFVLHPRFTFSFLPLPCASPPPSHPLPLIQLSPWHNDCRFASMLPAVLLTMLFYLDQNISVRAVNACNLKKVRFVVAPLPLPLLHIRTHARAWVEAESGKIANR